VKLNLSKSSTTTKLVASNTINKFPMDIQETINAHHGHHHRPIHYSLCRVEMSLPFMKLQPNVSIHNWLHYFILIQSYSSKSLVFFHFFLHFRFHHLPILCQSWTIRHPRPPLASPKRRRWHPLRSWTMAVDISMAAKNSWLEQKNISFTIWLFNIAMENHHF